MKSLRIKNSHVDFEYLDLELENGEENILVNLYNSENIHPNVIIDNQLDSIIRQIEQFYREKKSQIKREFEILIDVIVHGRRTHMMGLVRIGRR